MSFVRFFGAPASSIILETNEAGANHGTLSNGNLTFNYSPGSSAFWACWVRRSGARSGKSYWEFRLDGPDVVDTIIGVISQSEYVISSPNFYVANPLGETVYAAVQGGFGGVNTGLITNGTNTSDSAYAMAATNVIGNAWDWGAKKGWISINGTWVSGDPAAGTSPTFTIPDSAYDPYCTFYNASPKVFACTLHSAPASLTYTAPSGFTELEA